MGKYYRGRNNYYKNNNSIHRRNYYAYTYEYHNSYTTRRGNALIRTVNHAFISTDRRVNGANRLLANGQELCVYNGRQPSFNYLYGYENNYNNYKYRYCYDYQYYDSNNYGYRYQYKQIKRLY